MKKFVLVLSLVLMTAFTGCSGGGTAPTASTEATPNIQKIKDKGVLKVGVKVDVPKFGYKNPETQVIEGMEIDIAKAIAKEILGDENKIEFQAVTAKTRGPLLDSGELDLVIATFTITEERKESYNFSQPYFVDGVALLVKKDKGFTSYKDLDGKAIGVAQSATSKKALEEAAVEQGISVKFSEYASYPEIKAALESGRVDAFSVDAAILNGYLDENSEILADRFSPQEYGVASKKSNTDLAKVVDDLISEMKSNGELDSLIEKWGIK
ncbi:transporter substrate-binding domain-containing protein [Cellulosilyticum sp. I15G10I2]|uniref:transporter substrate-binding domain-containing protein n=1 Tax=Cellulosilyticum sp. I15G10I2 TaxID=1892843 RepID=UPI00085BC97B|nr:transporter substrate-binding domain-containing protein [Cellulosilyticum sp. I15G10I2]